MKMNSSMFIQAEDAELAPQSMPTRIASGIHSRFYDPDCSGLQILS